jgi:hypothetical protein
MSQIFFFLVITIFISFTQKRAAYNGLVELDMNGHKLWAWLQEFNAEDIWENAPHILVCI